MVMKLFLVKSVDTGNSQDQKAENYIKTANIYPANYKIFLFSIEDVQQDENNLKFPMPEFQRVAEVLVSLYSI